MHLRQTTFENIESKEEITHNEHFFYLDMFLILFSIYTFNNIAEMFSKSSAVGVLFVRKGYLYPFDIFL